MDKNFYLQYNIGKVKYAVSFHDGKDTHKDGSPFYGIQCFNNKKKMQKFCQQLTNEGYKSR